MNNATIKKSFTIRERNNERLQLFENQSSVVDQALALFFERMDYLKGAEDSFWDAKIRAGLLDVAEGRTTPINPGGAKITEDMLDTTLWA